MWDLQVSDEVIYLVILSELRVRTELQRFAAFLKKTSFRFGPKTLK